MKMSKLERKEGPNAAVVEARSMKTTKEKGFLDIMEPKIVWGSVKQVILFISILLALH
jgi:hypothetical protein